jgi:hypothetical protein
MKRLLLVALVAAMFVGFPALSVAGSIYAPGYGGDPTFVTGQENPDGVSGFQGNLTPLNVPITVASDGEAPFDPFGVGYDSTEQIKFDPNSVGPAAVSLNPAWQQFTANDGNPYSWALPAIAENEPSGEAVGHWQFNGYTVNGGPLIYNILDEDGKTVSDSIVIQNNAAGVAQLYFYSDPSVPTPEPASLTLLGLGALSLAGYGIRRRKQAVQG